MGCIYIFEQISKLKSVIATFETTADDVGTDEVDQTLEKKGSNISANPVV